MQLEKEFIDRWNITEYQIEKQFNSKKNNVYLVRADIEGACKKRFVLKQYKGGAATSQGKRTFWPNFTRGGLAFRSFITGCKVHSDGVYK